MTGNIAQVFKEKGSGKAFIPFITAGYPDKEGFERLFLTLAENGADIIEVGLPFSDPLADGPVIQESSHAALLGGMNVDKMFESVRKLSRETGVPVAVMSYFNPLYRYGIQRFLSVCNDNGVRGLIIPDLPLEEYETYNRLFNEANIDNIMLATLTTSRQRLKQISRIGRGFLYCVSVKGVTGQRKKVKEEVKQFLNSARQLASLPLALGFGLSSIEQINDIKGYTDGIIIGSKILSLIQEKGLDRGLIEVAQFSRKVKECLGGQIR